MLERSPKSEIKYDKSVGEIYKILILENLMSLFICKQIILIISKGSS